jgi:hypothetical protein
MSVKKCFFLALADSALERIPRGLVSQKRSLLLDLKNQLAQIFHFAPQVKIFPRKRILGADFIETLMHLLAADLRMVRISPWNNEQSIAIF